VAVDKLAASHPRACQPRRHVTTCLPFARALHFLPLLALTPLALAGTGDDIADDDKALEALLKREVLGPSRYAQRLMEAPASVSVLECSDAAALGHQTVGDMRA
jgi:iron complex outermembrane receptor protein